MKFAEPLQPATLVRRYKRFLADVTLASGATATVHCPNTGAMTGCAEPGSAVWLSRATNPKRKYPLTLEQVASRNGLVGVNTHLANRLVREGLEHQTLTELRGYATCQAEAAIPGGSGRFDFLLGHTDVQGCALPPCYVEVKSVTLATADGTGLFPDAVSARALKHLQALEQVVADGQRAVLLFCVQHSGIERVAPAAEIDPAYARGLRQAAARGVEVIAWRATQTPHGSTLDTPLPVLLDSAR